MAYIDYAKKHSMGYLTKDTLQKNKLATLDYNVMNTLFKWKKISMSEGRTKCSVTIFCEGVTGMGTGSPRKPRNTRATVRTPKPSTIVV